VAAPVPDIQIRSYHRSDRDQFAQLVSGVLAEYGFSIDPVLESDLEDPSTTYNRIWVAVHQEEVVGTVAMRLLGDGKVAELKRMYLHPAYRGQGLGRMLLHEAVAWAQTQRCRCDSPTLPETIIPSLPSGVEMVPAGGVRRRTRTRSPRFAHTRQTVIAPPPVFHPARGRSERLHVSTSEVLNLITRPIL